MEISGNRQAIRSLLVAILGAGALLGAPAIASANLASPVPRIKPAPPALSAYLSERDARLFRQGLRAVKRGKWSDVKSARDKINDPTAKDVLLWLRAARDPNAPMSYMSHAVENLPDWPRQTGIQSKAENQIFDERWGATKTINWFAGREPVSGEGRAALARAYYAKGRKAEAEKWLRLAWRESKLTRDRQKAVFGEFRHRLNKDDHYARADHLIWQGRSHFPKAQALLSHMNRVDRAVINARIKLATNGSGMDAAIKGVPSSRAQDAGLIYERAKWRRKRKSKDYALPVYLQFDIPPTNETGQKAVWRERRLMAYWAIAEENFSDAYKLTQNHGMDRGAGFAEAEFLAGWIALTKIRDADKAAEHFERLVGGVSTPVSLSRANYWAGRAHERSNSGQAPIFYAAARAFPNTYYGQLAATRMSGQNAPLSLPLEFVDEATKARFNSDRRIRALHLLGEAGEERYFSWFAFHLDDVLEDQGSLSLLSRLSKDYGFMRASLRAAKQAGRFQTMLTETGYPTVPIIDALPESRNRPFVYAIARQESEFATNAVSSAKAYGMMQMINSTAKYTARKHRIPYDRARLATDGEYAAQLGSLHLEDLLEKFDGSYILSAAAYNAGPTRANQWIKAYGDPRTGEIDPIDWIESVPFSETRNYIQRVMENMQVYRARLNGNTHPNQIDRDLTRGEM